MRKLLDCAIGSFTSVKEGKRGKHLRTPASRLFVVLTLLSGLSACHAEEEDDQTLELTPTALLAIEKYWGAIRESYLRVQKEPEDSFIATVTTLRRGDIVEIVERGTFISGTEGRQRENAWCKISVHEQTGWVLAAAVDIYPFYSQAEVAAEALSQETEGESASP